MKIKYPAMSFHAVVHVYAITSWPCPLRVQVCQNQTNAHAVSVPFRVHIYAIRSGHCPCHVFSIPLSGLRQHLWPCKFFVLSWAISMFSSTSVRSMSMFSSSSGQVNVHIFQYQWPGTLTCFSVPVSIHVHVNVFQYQRSSLCLCFLVPVARSMSMFSSTSNHALVFVHECVQ